MSVQDVSQIFPNLVILHAPFLILLCCLAQTQVEELGDREILHVQQQQLQLHILSSYSNDVSVLQMELVNHVPW